MYLIFAHVYRCKWGDEKEGVSLLEAISKRISMVWRRKFTGVPIVLLVIDCL